MRAIAIFMSLLCLPLLADFSGEVVGVSDGDTITVLKEGRSRVKVRLAGVDCPEKAQPFGQKAKAFASALCFGKVATIREHGQDRYGRTLGNVELGGKDLSMELLKAGLAWHYVKYDKSPVLAKAEAKAREAKLGLWAEAMPVPPWEWRKQRKARGGR